MNEIFNTWFTYNVFAREGFTSIDLLIQDFISYTGVKISEFDMTEMLRRYDVAVTEKTVYGIKLWDEI